eukprot:scaffold36864_cov63-Phaeocystis_antarctica.AAC.1
MNIPAYAGGYSYQKAFKWNPPLSTLGTARRRREPHPCPPRHRRHPRRHHHAALGVWAPLAGGHRAVMPLVPLETNTFE